MAAQIKIAKVGVPNENNTGIALSTVTSAPEAPPKVDKLDIASTTAMSTNNMPAGRRP